MFNEIPKQPPYNNDPSMKPQVRDYKHMLQLLDQIIDSAPKWSPLVDQAELIGSPINVILEWPTNTYSGNAFFLRKTSMSNGLKFWADGQSTYSCKKNIAMLRREPCSDTL